MTDPKKNTGDSKPSQAPEKTAEASAPTPASPVVPQNPPVNQQDEVKAALARKTQDGRGEDEVPESDFVSFATDNVEKAPVEVIADEVLNGRWGDPKQSRQMLREAGYDPREVQIEVNRRLAAGAPSAYQLTVKDIASQAIAGLWGTEKAMSRNIDAAGYNFKEVQVEIKRQLGG